MGKKITEIASQCQVQENTHDNNSFATGYEYPLKKAIRLLNFGKRQEAGFYFKQAQKAFNALYEDLKD